MNKQRIEALKQIKSLADKYNISADEISNSLVQQNTKNNYTKIFLYIGIILVITTISTLLSQFWTEIHDSTKVLSVMGTGIVSYIIMIKLHDIKHDLITPFAIFSTISIVLGIFLALSLTFPKISDTTPTILIVCLLMALQQLFTYLYLRITTPIFFIILFTSISYLAAASLLHIDHNLTFFILGISYIFLSLYFYHSPHAPIVFLGFFCGAIATNLSAYFFMYKSTIEPVVTILFAIQLYLGIKIQSKTLISVNIVAFILYLINLTSRLFHKSIPWLAAISAIGLCLITGVIFYAKTSKKTN